MTSRAACWDSPREVVGLYYGNTGIFNQTGGAITLAPYFYPVHRREWNSKRGCTGDLHHGTKFPAVIGQ